ncbi:MAG: DUF2339 domain-containing protein [Crocinitomicaceae bacterium]|nr:DUF2339 domain-containing protein [Crocinitomicaceae bacterium]
MEILGVLTITGLGILIGMLSKFRQVTTQNFKVINKRILELKSELTNVKSIGTVPKTIAEEKKLKVDGQKLVTSISPIQKPVEKKIEPKIQTEIPIDKKEEKLEKAISEEKATSLIKPLVKEKNESEPLSRKFQESQEKNLEKVIGENWLNKIGIGILVLGLGFFVKYAIDQNWIGELGRVLIGLASGGVLISIAHFLRKKYSAFSSVLIGGGLSTFYYTITIAYQYYHMFSQGVGFAAVTGITLLGVMLSIIYNKKELAIISLVGAFTAPFMVPGNNPNMAVFFTYIAIVNTGLMILSFVKNWRILSHLSFGFTLIYFGSWTIITAMFNHNDAEELRVLGIIFGSIYFIQFLGMILTFNLVKKIPFKAFQMIQLLTVSGFYFGVMMMALNTLNDPDIQGLFSAGLGVFYFGLVMLLKNRADDQLKYTLIGKGILFATLAIVLIFSTKYTTIFWSLEALLLIWLGRQTSYRIYRVAGGLIHILAAISLAFGWSISFFDEVIYIGVLSANFYSGIVLAISLLTSKYILEKDEKLIKLPIVAQMGMVYSVAATVLVYCVGLFEINIYADNSALTTQAHYMILWGYHGVVVLALAIWKGLSKHSIMTELSFFIGIVYLFVFAWLGGNFIDDVRESALLDGYRGLFNSHYLIVGIVITLIVFIRKLSFSIFEEEKSRLVFMCVLSLLGLAVFCRELDQFLAGTMVSDIVASEVMLRHIHVAGYTVTWGIFAFDLMIFGLKKDIRTIRVFALIAFAGTLFKLFTYDILNISTGGKIVAFISLGILLLIVSFLYQKLKQLIVDGASTDSATGG